MLCTLCSSDTINHSDPDPVTRIQPVLYNICNKPTDTHGIDPYQQKVPPTLPTLPYLTLTYLTLPYLTRPYLTLVAVLHSVHRSSPMQYSTHEAGPSTHSLSSTFF